MQGNGRRLGVRWSIGDASLQGFEALRISVWGAWKLFGDRADYVICLNSISQALARELTGGLPSEVSWREVSNGDIPDFLVRSLVPGTTRRAAWRFAPLRVFPDRYELSLDNDLILWDMPEALRKWLSDEGDSRERCLLAEGMMAGFGRFAPIRAPDPSSLGLRGFPPGFDLAKALGRVLADHPGRTTSELDEQGLQIAALSVVQEPTVVSAEDISVCSPFGAQSSRLGRCGAHFVGLNARQLPWSLEGRPASEYVRENWCRLRDIVLERVSPPLWPCSLAAA